jgi:hypothetical protein
MSWQWSRLSTFVLLGLLYVSPLSSGDKGLWLSVASMPFQQFGSIPGEMPPEHSILLPYRVGLALAAVRFDRGEPAPGPGLLAVANAPTPTRSECVGDTSAWSALDETCPAPSAPRGPPVRA